MRKNSVKNIRINSEVQREMSSIIRVDLKDPRIHPMTSVMAVEVTPDLKFAKIFVSVLGNDEEKEKTMETLRAHFSVLYIYRCDDGAVFRASQTELFLKRKKGAGRNIRGNQISSADRVSIAAAGCGCGIS